MNLPPPADVQRVTVIGTGVAGAGWAAHFLGQGMAVTAYDPTAGAEARLREMIAAAWPRLAQLGLGSEASQERLAFALDIATAVASAQFVQECMPGEDALKIQAVREIDAVAPPNVVIACSSSGISLSRAQQGCQHPERCIAAHTLVPTYLVPLVELVPGKQTSQAVAAWAADFYMATGKRPLRLGKEIPGSVTGRLLATIWREALQLIAEGVVTVEEVDAAMADGPGLLWAAMGPMLGAHLIGDAGGVGHFLDQQAPALDPRGTVTESPEVTPPLRESLIKGSERAVGGRTIQALEDERDQRLTGILRARQERRDSKQATAQRGPSSEIGDYMRWSPESAIDRPLGLYQCVVADDWIDYNGHMTEGAYLIAFGYASDALFRYIGIDEAYRAAGYSFYTVETHINFYREASAGEPLQMTTQLLGLDEKRLHFFHSMFHGVSGVLLATTEQMLVHVDMNAAAASVINAGVFEALSAIMAVHVDMPRPAQVGRQMAIKKK